MERNLYDIGVRISQENEYALDERVMEAREEMQGLYALVNSLVDRRERMRKLKVDPVKYKQVLPSWVQRNEDGIVCNFPQPHSYRMRLNEEGDIHPESWALAELEEKDILSGWEYLEVSRQSIEEFGKMLSGDKLT